MSFDNNQYRIVRISTDENCGLQNSHVIIPAVYTYIHNNQLYVRYLPPPLNKNKYKNYQECVKDIVKNKSPVPSNWGSYMCEHSSYSGI